MLDNKGGNSSSKDRIEVIEQVLESYDKSSIENIMGDKEFYSIEFANWLEKEKLPYTLRVKENLEFVRFHVN